MPTRPRTGRLVAVLLMVLAVLAVPGTARAASTTTAAPRRPQLPKTWILVDADTGRVLDERDDHVLRRPASTIKLLTALTAERMLKPDALIPVSPLAAGMPARNIGLKAGDRWPLSDMLDSMLVVSANDAAAAVAEAAAGSVAKFGTEMERTARELGAVDSPTMADPAGLDDAQFGEGGGDWISAWDMAVIGAAALRDPAIMARASQPIVRFTDPAGAQHRLVNHNKLLGMYPGANGLKTGFTSAAGNTLVASATRDGRTMLVVVFDAPDLYNPVKALMDKGFATPAAAETGPLLSTRALPPPTTTTLATEVRHDTVRPVRPASSWSVGRDELEWAVLVLAASAVLVIEVRRRRRRPGIL